MCDFWVSQARHYCNYCKVWTSGSKESVRRHEEGARHKDRVAQILKKKRQGPRVPADARNLQKQLADIIQLFLYALGIVTTTLAVVYMKETAERAKLIEST